jgi:hypothetical protein
MRIHCRIEGRRGSRWSDETVTGLSAYAPWPTPRALPLWPFTLGRVYGVCETRDDGSQLA